MDKVFIEGLEVEAVIGIYDWERRIRQPLVLDLWLSFDNRVPAASDAIGDTLDYKAISKRLIRFVSESEFGLVETLAERCAALVLDEFDVHKVKLKLSKPGAVRGARAVGVIIKRKRDETPARAQAPGAVGQETDETVDATPVVEAPVAEQVVAEAPVAEAPPVVESRVPEAPAPEPPVVEVPVAGPTVVAAPTTPPPAEDPRSLASRFRARLRVGRETYLSLGSNIEPETNLRAAVAALRERFGEVAVSPVYRTKSVGFDGPDFLNCIARIDCDTDPFALHRWLHRLEEDHGRDRRDSPYSNRPLDIDIVYFGTLVLDVGVLQLPRPELRYAFVLKPMVDLAPDFEDPLREATMAELWAAHPEHDSPPERVDLAL